jgi:zinc D-Ala-D-Ala carboxypeptidase
MIARILNEIYVTSDGRLTRFRREELACRCGCGLDDMEESCIDALHEARTAFGHPMIPTSGVRCGSWNLEIGGATDSAHLYGLAVDLQSTMDLYALYLMLKSHFRRVSMYSRSKGYFCHADMRIDGPAIWDVVTCDGNFLFMNFLERYMITAVRDSINEVLEAT